MNGVNSWELSIVSGPLKRVHSLNFALIKSLADLLT